MITPRKDFPYFANKENAVFFDTAASAQKPRKMIERITHFYCYEYANIHRGMYNLSSNASHKFEFVRKKVAKFINASSKKEIIFTKNATECFNLIASSFLSKILQSNDEIIISSLEHHSNFVPWQILCNKKNSKLIIIKFNNNGLLDPKEIKMLISKKTKFIAITHMSNVFGSLVDIKPIIKIANKNNIPILIDACQSIVHKKIDVKNIGCDFLVFSAHKLYGPSGVGILFIKKKFMNLFDPYQVGGAVINNVSFEKTFFNTSPIVLEAGTPLIANIIGFGATLDYLNEIQWQNFTLNKKNLTNTIRESISNMRSYKILSTTNDSIISFIHFRAHHSDIGTLLNQQKIAVRTGHLCAQLLMNKLGINGAVRISIGIYNNKHDVKKLINALYKINKIL